ncbi:hypothetical protein DAEQUDRAFT_543073 [Daedalea quercina L-15889]|uniref:Uncharacterized protein n=1 Tax=Daedalea quercina L-15889 TaxID=1314783 RepID=A0A165M4G5_9APHY|nr:hypothetical protein DAEQUDRAFT_543073 [Daedalea quercina L-15889]
MLLLALLKAVHRLPKVPRACTSTHDVTGSPLKHGVKNVSVAAVHHECKLWPIPVERLTIEQLGIQRRDEATCRVQHRCLARQPNLPPYSAGEWPDIFVFRDRALTLRTASAALASGEFLLRVSRQDCMVMASKFNLPSRTLTGDCEDSGTRDNISCRHTL